MAQDRVTLNLADWFGIAVSVHRRDDTGVTTLSIPGHIAKVLNLKDESTVRVYIEKVKKE